MPAADAKKDQLAALPTRGRLRTPTFLQMEAVECGAACLGIILAHYGRWVPLEQLRVDCGVSRDGSTAANVLLAGQSYGLAGGGYKVELDGFDRVKLPCIVFWEFNHFLVIDGFGPGRVYLNDPACGRRTISAAEFDKGFSGIVLTFEPGPDFKPGGRKPGIATSLGRRLSGTRAGVAFVVLAGLGLVIPGLAIPTFSKIFVDEILIGGSSRWLGRLLAGLAVAALLRAALTALQQHYLMRSSTKLAITSTGRFLWHVLRLPMEFFTQRYAGEVSNRIASNERVAAVLTGELATSVIGLVTALFYVLLMLSYDVVLTAIGVSLSLVNLFVLRTVNRKRADESQRLLQETGKLMATAMGGVQCIESIKASARESDFFARWSGYQAKASASEQRMADSSGFLATLPAVISMASTAVVLGAGGLRVMEGSLTIGMLVAFQSLLASFSRPINDLVRLGAVVQQLTGDMKRLDDVTNYHVDEPFAREDSAPGSPQRRLSGFLELRNITFGYNRLGEPLLKDFSLKLAPGDRVAIVGASGSGKSTVARLVSGLYRPWSGQVLFDGVARETLPRTLLANSFAMVDQQVFLFEGSVRENLSLWDPTLPDSAIQRAAKDAHIHEDVAARRGAYAGKVEEGGRNFSGGQKQRLEIARALAIEPSILVLDEATSALDAATEKVVDDHIRRRGCTCVIVAHRLSTIRDCNEIIVLERGRVVQRGTHEDLMAQGDGAYKRLITTE